MSHNNEYMQHFAAILSGESIIAEKKTAIDKLNEQAFLIQAEIATVVNKQASSWIRIQELMNETGEFEVTLPGKGCDYKIAYTSPRESVKVVDEAAVPDQFVKLERKPMRPQISEYLKSLRERGEAMPNWAALECGEKKLTYKLIKKKASAA